MHEHLSDEQTTRVHVLELKMRKLEALEWICDAKRGCLTGDVSGEAGQISGT